MNRTQHNANEVCHPIHCWVHNVDERHQGTYLVCFECNHAYPTRRSVWWANLVVITQMTFYISPEDHWWTGWFKPKVEGFGSRRRDLVSWQRSWFRKAKTIITCPHCGHDF